MRLSLRAGWETLKARHWGRWTRRAREALRKAKGTSFEAIVEVLRVELRVMAIQLES